MADLFNTRCAVKVNNLSARTSGLTPEALNQVFGGYWNWFDFYIGNMPCAAAPEQNEPVVPGELI
jgi:hypothetical protein